MKAIELNVPDDVYRKLADLAAHDEQPVNEFALRTLLNSVRAVESFAELERRAQRGDINKFKAAMAQVPDAPPITGDELPD